MADIEKYLLEEESTPQPEDIRGKVLRYVGKMRRISLLLGKVDYYTYFYISCVDDFDPNVDVMAMTYKDLTTLYMPKIVHGPNLIPFIERVLEERPNIADKFIKEMDLEKLPPEAKEVVKRYYVFKEIVKHEIIHYVNMHLPRIMEFFKKKGFVTVPPDILEAANIYADSICNIYLDKNLVEAGGLIPPLPHEVRLEDLLEKIDIRNPKKQLPIPNQQHEGSGQQQDQGTSQGVGGGGQQRKDKSKGRGKGTGKKETEIGKDKMEGEEGGEGKKTRKSNPAQEYGQYKDLLPKEVREVEKHNLDHVKDVLKKVLDHINDKYRGNPRAIGTIPGEIEEAIKWLSKRTVKHKLVGEGDVYGIFKDIQQTYMYYNPKNENPYGYIFPSYKPLTGPMVAVIVDTSGSMDPDRLSYAIDIINSVVTKAEAYLVEIDAKIQRVSKVNQIKNEFTFKGRGGTEFDDLERLPQLIPVANIKTCIILTDGGIYSFPAKNPIPWAQWIGITTDVIPEKSPNWIKWMKVEDVIEGEEGGK